MAMCHILRITTIKEREIDSLKLKHIELPKMISEGLLLKDGDVLLVRTSGSRDCGRDLCCLTTGKANSFSLHYLIRFDSILKA